MAKTVREQINADIDQFDADAKLMRKMHCEALDEKIRMAAVIRGIDERAEVYARLEAFATAMKLRALARMATIDHAAKARADTGGGGEQVGQPIAHAGFSENLTETGR